MVTGVVCGFQSASESVKVLVRWIQLLATSWTIKPTGLLCPWDSPDKNTGVGSHSLLQDLPNLEIEPGSPTLWADSLPCEPPGKPTVF